MSNNNYSPDMVANNLSPAFPTHPGAVLKEEIEYRGISQKQLVKDMGISYSALNKILNGKLPLSEQTALLFEDALEINAKPLLRLQLLYDREIAKKEKGIRHTGAV